MTTGAKTIYRILSADLQLDKSTVGYDARDQEGEEKSDEQRYFLSAPW
jgi:hypothetical protein